MPLQKDFYHKRMSFFIGLLLFFSSGSLFATPSSFGIVINNGVPYEGHLSKYFVDSVSQTPPNGSNLILAAVSGTSGYVPTNTQFIENYPGVGDSVYFYSFYDQKQNPLGIACTFIIHSDYTTLGTNCSGLKVQGILVEDNGNTAVVFTLKPLSNPDKKA